MPVRKPVFPYLSYITAEGDEVVLSNEGNYKWWECYGRKGFTAPELDYVTRQYADGATDTLAVILKPRNLTVQMFVLGETTRERDEILRDIASRLIQTGTRKNWGKLKLRRSDEQYLLIDCVYIGGMDEIVEQYPNIQQFQLNFYSGNGYFYDSNETMLTTQTLGELLYLSDDIYLSNNLYLTDTVSGLQVLNSGEVFYPIIEIYGPASVIKVTNEATGLTLAVDPSFSLLANQKLTFNCMEHERGIFFTDANNNMTDVTEELALGSSLVWPIVKGSNYLTFYYTDSGQSTYATIRYHQRYYSI